ncbi:MAG: sigma-54-dependent Fis family transcriptional regulator [Bdellovibrionaceae bacterium]|nr:sigma-54-dependent Fis family transcriptional regulator [Bdellovibrionales bacterium]MCB9253360.1 sigma-54-dependent Fis family transcriptional regulator [Pseudobdellovibrionaceae bacterium]
MSKYSIAIVDDELSNLDSLERILKSDGAEVHRFQNAKDVVPILQNGHIDVVLTDLRMGAMSGLDLLEVVRTSHPSIEVILVTAYGTVEIAVEAMKKGAYDFITKPLQRMQVLRVVHKAVEKRKLVAENLSLREELKSQMQGKDRPIIGRSAALKGMMDLVEQAARSRANVLIGGESGTGKGLLAEYLHRNSQESSGMFVKINCTAIPDNLLEAELFGYEPGAYTGAAKTKKGRVELAHGGTLFLDEIGIAPQSLQTKLLRFLQEGEFERLGSNQTRYVETRVISASNTDLKKAVAEGVFREDLFYRLNVIHINVPPLRERVEDIPLLARRFLETSAKKNGRSIPILHSETLDALIRYAWPGNVRELENVMERVVVLNRTGSVEVEDLPPEIAGGKKEHKTIVIPVGLTLRQIEKLVMDRTLKSTRGDKRLAARLLGVHPRTIYRHLESIVKEEKPTAETPSE